MNARIPSEMARNHQIRMAGERHPVGCAQYGGRVRASEGILASVLS
jgi:hypothetical protein